MAVVVHFNADLALSVRIQDDNCEHNTQYTFPSGKSPPVHNGWFWLTRWGGVSVISLIKDHYIIIAIIIFAIMLGLCASFKVLVIASIDLLINWDH